MKFSIDKNLFLVNLLVAQKALSAKTPNPALQGILLDVNNNLTLTTNNSDIAITVSINDPSLVIESEGSCLIPGKYFIEIVKKLDGDTISLSLLSDNILRIVAGKTDVTLNLMDVEDYPHLNFALAQNPIILPAKLLKTIIKQTTFACSTIENRPILTGVNLKINNGELTTVSTDSFRLSQKIVDVSPELDGINIIIPGRSLDDLSKIIEQENGDIELHIDNSKILFKFSNVLFQSRLLEGNYPETSRLIPNDFPIELKFNRDDLITAIERASTFTSKDGNTIVKFTLNQDQTVQITSNSPEIGTITEDVRLLEIIKGSQFKIAFSSKYILEAIKTFNSEELFIKFTGEIRPFILEAESEPGLIELILPVRTE